MLFQTIYPIDSAFVSIGSPEPLQNAGDAALWSDSIWISLAILFSILTVMPILKQATGLIPSLLSCAVRWKENVNLADSTKLTRDRNIVCLACILPFCLVCARFRLWNPSFTEGLTHELQLAITCGVFAAYALARVLARVIVGYGEIKKRTFDTANACAGSFLIILTAIMVITVLGMNIGKAGIELTRKVLLWETALIFTLFSLRKSQILQTSCSFFSTFLYLCALELIPAILVVVPVMLF